MEELMFFGIYFVVGSITALITMVFSSMSKPDGILGAGLTLFILLAWPLVWLAVIFALFVGTLEVLAKAIANSLRR